MKTTSTVALIVTAAVGPIVVAVTPPLGAPVQGVWQADVRVQSLDVSVPRGGTQMTVHTVIYSDNDDDARAVRADILLPVGVGVLRLPAGCKASPAAVPNLNARVTCDLGDLAVRGFRDLTVVTTSAGSLRARFAVLVVSDTPDPDPANNYAERWVP
jgi:hypothetical protein